jgi:hypothetical protein
LHFTDVLTRFLLVYSPLVVLGTPAEIIFWYTSFISIFGVIGHSNIELEVPSVFHWVFGDNYSGAPATITLAHSARPGGEPEGCGIGIPMVTDAQVRLLRQKRMEGKTQEAAGAAAGVSRRTEQRWEGGTLPSERTRVRTWRTRADPFVAVWQGELVPLLEADERGVLEATTLMEVLEQRYPGRFPSGQVRTLQRRVRDWRALHGPEREVFFEQEHPPGREAQLDFTHATELGVTIGGELFVHLLFQLVLSFSGWRWVQIALGETFEALVAGLQGALWALGGVPAVVRHDNLSAATHELRHSAGRDLTQRFRHVLEHYGLTSTRIRPGEGHENGVAEQANDRLKSRLEQALVLRGSRDFARLGDYQSFIDEIVGRLNGRLGERVEQDREQLRPLPPAAIPSYTSFACTVRRWSTIRLGNRTYSVPSRLIGHRLEARQHPDVVEVYYRGRPIETMARLRGDRDHRIDYRHVIWSLVRKPGAFARYRYREDLFPSLTFRRAYDALRERRGERADIEYVRILHLAASTMEADVERVLCRVLEAGTPFDYAAVRAEVAPRQAAVPTVSVPEPDLSVYDRLLAGGAR